MTRNTETATVKAVKLEDDEMAFAAYIGLFADVIEATRDAAPDPSEYDPHTVAAQVEFDAETYEILGIEVNDP